MKPYYECHITFDGDEGKHITESLGWTYSRIDGDPTLGNGVRQYATIHINTRSPQDVVEQMLLSTADTMRHRGLRITRAKIELVLFDKRYPTS